MIARTHLFTSAQLRFLQKALLLPLLLLAIVGLWDAGLRFWYEARSPFTWDSPIYWAVGRGILNGLVPYRDLFETKPPGIFLLSALSFKLFNSPILGHLIDACSAFLYPLLLGLFTWSAASQAKLKNLSKVLCVLVAVPAGCLLALYTLERSGEFQVESFGALFSLFYLITISGRSKVTLLQMMGASAFLLGAIGMKEPFLLACVGGAFIVCANNPLRLLRALLYPLLMGGAAGLIILWFLGYLDPYVTIYLPEILSKEINTTTPLLQQLFDWENIAKDLSQYSFALGLFLVFCIGTTCLEPLPAKHRFFTLFCRIFLVLIGLYLGAKAVALKGNFYNHHYAFAIPVYTAVVIAFLFNLVHLKKQKWISYDCIVLTVLFLGVSILNEVRPNYEARIQPLKNYTLQQRTMARSIDMIMDQCHIDQYLFLGINGPQPFGYTKHSPMGPIFFQFNHFLDPAFPSFRTHFLHNLQKANLIVQNNGELNDLQNETMRYIDSYFSSVPWSCVQGTPQGIVPGYRILYRKGAILP